MSRSLRMFEIIQFLRQSTRPMTAAQIAEHLEVTPRTVYRDIAALQARHVPVEGEAGVGYVMRPGFDVPPLMFTTEELEAITTGLTLLARTNDHGLAAAAKQVTAKIRDVVPTVSRGTLIDSAVFASTLHRMPDSEVDADEIRKFVHDGEKVEIIYADTTDRETTRTILPIAMIFYMEAIVVVAWCFLRDDYRHFRLDRIESATGTGELLPERVGELRAEWRERIREPWVIASP